MHLSGVAFAHYYHRNNMTPNIRGGPKLVYRNVRYEFINYGLVPFIASCSGWMRPNRLVLPMPLPSPTSPPRSRVQTHKGTSRPTKFILREMLVRVTKKNLSPFSHNAHALQRLRAVRWRVTHNSLYFAYKWCNIYGTQTRPYKHANIANTPCVFQVCVQMEKVLFFANNSPINHLQQLFTKRPQLVSWVENVIFLSRIFDNN